ncbi:hypothetical protein ACFROC_15995 [Nocardia tengchongensis]|uniref:hypothetical protein n=1 Tax=Nocardia tengchongensis TaxID=2055889 RepID=UPI0036BF4FD0
MSTQWTGAAAETEDSIMFQPGTQIRPSLRWVVAGALVIVAAIVGAFVFGVVSYILMRNQVTGFQRVTVPGSGDVRLVAGNDYTIYFERGQASDELPTVTVTLTDPLGQPVTLSGNPHTGYQLAGRDGEGEFDFHAHEGGTYHLTGQEGSGGTVAVGAALAPSIARTVLGPLLIGAIGLIAGIAMIIITVALRGRHPGFPMPVAGTARHPRTLL